jgi:phosphoribosylformylglycinamidine synthase
VSLYNETNGRAILPTPAIGGVGILDDAQRMATLGFKRAGDTIILIGETTGHVGASLWLREIGGLEAGPPPPVDLVAERRNGDFVRALIGGGLVNACHDLADGGLLIALAEMAMAGGIGAEIEPPAGAAPLPHRLFGEDQGRYLIACADAAAILKRAAAAGVTAVAIGRTGGAALTVQGHPPISLDKVRDAYEGWLPRYMAGPEESPRSQR